MSPYCSMYPAIHCKKKHSEKQQAIAAPMTCVCVCSVREQSVLHCYREAILASNLNMSLQFKSLVQCAFLSAQ